jgi:methane/ammonia monooxygenase subunit B
MVAKARWEGDWHVHPMVNVKDAGGLVGPGVAYTVAGSYLDYRHGVKTISGLEIEDISNYAMDRVYTWHAIWIVLGLVWVVWWIRRPLLMPRYLMTKHGDYEDTLVTKTDRTVSGVAIICLLALVIGSMVVTTNEYPRTITLQAGKAIIPPLEKPKSIQIDMQEGQYYIPGRTVIAKMLVTNNQDRPIRLGEFSSANLRFLDRTVNGVNDGKEDNFPQELIANEPLRISDNSALMPGESRVMRIDATDAAWEVERLSSLLNDPESTLGALLFFYYDEGNRYISELFGNIIPVYKDDII